MTIIATVHGVRVTDENQLVPTDARMVNPKQIPYRDYVREQEWNLLQRAHWQRCRCPLCDQPVIIPDWSLHWLMHTRELHMIGLILETIMKMFQYGEDKLEEAPPKAA